jgi:hypothetical protein
MANRLSQPVFNLHRLTVFALMAVTVVATIVAAIMLFNPRSLWFDEAALADNIIRRSLIGLIDSPLDNGQSAPALYLVAVKLSTIAFGCSKPAIRLISFIAYIWMLLATFALLRNAFRVDRLFVWLGVAIAATLSIFLRYATEQKQYMVETAAVLTAIYAFWLCHSKRLNISALSLIYIMLILLSNNVIFFIFMSFFVIIVIDLKNRKFTEALSAMVHGLAVASMFGIYYLLWLAIVANSDFMQDFWREWAFRLTPFAWHRYYRNGVMLIHIFREINPSIAIRVAMLTVAAAGFIVSLRKKSAVSAVVGLAFALFIVASHFGMAPLSFRLCLFFFSLTVIYIIIFLNYCSTHLPVVKHFAWTKYALAGIAIALFYNNIHFVSNRNYVNPYDNTQPMLEYVSKHIRPDETLYSYLCCNYVVRFETRYSNHIGASRQEIIYGQNVYDWFGGKFNRKAAAEYAINPWEMVWDYGYDWNYPNEIDRIVAAGKVYILFSHLLSYDPYCMIGYGLDRLCEQGVLVKIMQENKSLLYYFSANEVNESPVIPPNN